MLYLFLRIKPLEYVFSLENLIYFSSKSKLLFQKKIMFRRNFERVIWLKHFDYFIFQPDSAGHMYHSVDLVSIVIFLSASWNRKNDFVSVPSSTSTGRSQSSMVTVTIKEWDAMIVFLCQWVWVWMFKRNGYSNHVYDRNDLFWLQNPDSAVEIDL